MDKRVLDALGLLFHSKVELLLCGLLLFTRKRFSRWQGRDIKSSREYFMQMALRQWDTSIGYVVQGKSLAASRDRSYNQKTIYYNRHPTGPHKDNVFIKFVIHKAMSIFQKLCCIIMYCHTNIKIINLKYRLLIKIEKWFKLRTRLSPRKSLLKIG